MQTETKELKIAPQTDAWTCVDLPLAVFQKCTSVRDLQKSIQELRLHSGLQQTDIELMFIDGDFETTLIRSPIEFHAWKVWNATSANRNVYYRSKQYADQKESDNHALVACSSYSSLRSLDAKQDTRTTLCSLTSARKKNEFKFRILAEHPIAIISKTSKQYNVQQRWTIQNTGATALQNCFEDESVNEHELPRSLRVVALNIPQQCILSMSLPFRCEPKETAHVQVEFRYEIEQKYAFASSSSSSFSAKTLYFQFAWTSSEHTSKDVKQQTKLFGPRFSVFLSDDQLLYLSKIDDVLERLKWFNLRTSRAKLKVLCHDLLMTQRKDIPIEELICKIVDKCC